MATRYHFELLSFYVVQPSGYRFYPSDAVPRVRFIKRAQELGFSLAEIRQLLTIRVDPMNDCADVRRLAQEKTADIAAKIRTLERMSKVLTAWQEHAPAADQRASAPPDRSAVWSSS